MKFIDLFSGIGGFHLGLAKLGLKCVFSSEIEKNARLVYSLNFHKPSGDITKIDAKDIPDHNILTAGFPYQNFSLLGKKEGFKEERGNLFLEVIRILKEKKPRFFILENVIGLKHIQNGECIKEICKQLNLTGYQTHLKTLNSADFGVPQYRRRVYFIGFLYDKDFFAFREPEVKPRVKLKDILEEGEVDTRYYVPEKRVKTFKKKKNYQDTNLAGDYIKMEGYFEEPFVARRRVYSIEGCASTLLSGNADNSKILLNGRIRWLTEKELLKCQGFPSDFKLGGISYLAVNKVIGNAVTVNVIEAIGKELLRLK